MKYVRKVIDMDTGKTCWTDLGDHRPFTEVATMFGIGPRKFREVLAAMGVASREYDAAGSTFRYRLTPWAVDSGLGYRMDNVGFAFDAERTPFDVLSPQGVDYVRDNLRDTLAKLAEPSTAIREALVSLQRFEETRRGPLDNHGRVLWLDDHHPDLPAPGIAAALGIGERVVRRYRAMRDARRQSVSAWVEATDAASKAAVAAKRVFPESPQALAA